MQERKLHEASFLNIRRGVFSSFCLKQVLANQQISHRQQGQLSK